MKNVKPGHAQPIVCLDAGHYGKYNRSPGVPEYYESEMNWKLHLLLKAELESYGIRVITTRADPKKDLGLQARGRMGKDCDLVLSIHSNAVGRKSADKNGMNEETDYPVAYVPIDGTADGLGKALAQCVASVMGTRQEGRATVRKSENGNWDYYSVIYGAVSVGTPGIILEHSFHTCTRSAVWLLQERNLEELAAAEAAVIAGYFGLKKRKTLYRVQVGAYYKKAYAEKALSKARAAGFADAFLAEEEA